MGTFFSDKYDVSVSRKTDLPAPDCQLTNSLASAGEWDFVLSIKFQFVVECDLLTERDGQGQAEQLGKYLEHKCIPRNSRRKGRATCLLPKKKDCVSFRIRVGLPCWAQLLWALPWRKCAPKPGHLCGHSLFHILRH